MARKQSLPLPHVPLAFFSYTFIMLESALARQSEQKMLLP